MAKQKQKRFYILYDDRAAAGDTDAAIVLDTARSEKEALKLRGDYGGMSCFSYEEVPNGDQIDLVDERFEWNWFPGDPK